VDIVLDVDSWVVDIVVLVEDDHNPVLEDIHLLDASLDNLDEMEAVAVVLVAFVAVEVVFVAVLVFVVLLAFVVVLASAA
jgi:hypothetical protein